MILPASLRTDRTLRLGAAEIYIDRAECYRCPRSKERWCER